ncbi:MAG: DUF4026 domain-containing protein [Planctomycetes bacterium]|nr:DUF4026 domain-containing protein [Planctomycetota bacterium]
MGVLAAVRAALGRDLEVLDEDSEPPRVLWHAAVNLGGEGEESHLWCEPASELAGKAQGGRPVKWIVGIETFLQPNRPVESYTELLGLAARAFDDSPCVVDLETSRDFRRETLDLFAGRSDLILPDRSLWTVHSVYDPDDRQRNAWLHTHGLWRCGRIELEVLDVPPEGAAAAGEIVNDVASLLLDEPPPAPGEPFVIGGDVEVVLQPWQKTVPGLPAGALGTLEDRKGIGDDSHLGARAVICSPRTADEADRVWTWPREAVEYFGGPDPIVRRSSAATERTARQARATWPELAMAFFALKGRAGGRAAEAQFLAKVGFRRSDDASGASREHIWLDVLGIEKLRAEGEVLNTPHHVEGVKLGAVVRFDVADLSEWVVVTPGARFGPHEAQALWRHCSGG